MPSEKIYRDVIDVFNQKSEYDFDSHEFINVLKRSSPQFYYQSLIAYIPEDILEKTYQLYHAQIGRDLSRLQAELGIQVQGKHLSPNYHKEYSENAKWKKI